MSGYRVQPQICHLTQVKGMYGYLCKFCHDKIQFCTEEIDYSMIPHQEYNWDNTPYGDEEESLPMEVPPPLGKYVVLTHYFDANLMHDVLAGKVVTGCFYLVNKTPIMWYLKKQATSETAMYDSKFIASRTCCE